MKKHITNLILILITLAVLSIGVFSQTGAITFAGKLTDGTSTQPTAFTYQGKLTDGGMPANGTYDFQFTLYDAANVNLGSAAGALPVINGIFTASIDGAAPLFTSSNPAVLLEIGVKLSGGGSYTTLAPRQPITSSPYAIKSLTAASSETLSVTCVSCVADSQISSINAAKITGVLSPSQGGTGIGPAPPVIGTFLRSNGAGWQAAGIQASDIPSNISVAASGITGVLGTSQGGTGSATQNFVDLTSTQTNIGGDKTFTGTLSGNAVGIGTAAPSAKLSVVSGPTELTGTAQSATFRTTAGTLGGNVGDELSLGSIGFFSTNNSSLGMRALRTAAGTDWPTTAIGLGMDVDNTVRAGAALWLHANSNVGIGTATPTAKLHVVGDGLFTGNLNVTGTVTGNGSGLTNLSGSSLNAGSVNAPQLGALSVSSTALGDGAVLTNKIFDGAVTTGKLADGSVTMPKIVDGAVTTAKIADGSVTKTKLAFDPSVRYDPQLLAMGRWDLLQTAKTVAVGSEPVALAFDGTFIYVANRSGGTVTRIRASTGVVEGGPITVGSLPVALAFDGTFVYVANTASNNITRIRASTGLVEGSPIAVAAQPVALVNTGTFIYVACGSGNSVVRIRASTGVVEGTTQLFAATHALAFDGTWVFVAVDDKFGTEIRKINAATGVLQSGSIGMPGNPQEMAFDGTYVYTGDFGAGLVRRFNASTASWDSGFSASISAPISLTFDGTFIYVAPRTGSNDSLRRIRVSSGTIEGSPIPVGAIPSGMLFDGSFVWVALRDDNAVKRF